jgi:methyl-accepting chemotaxis protein
LATRVWLALVVVALLGLIAGGLGLVAGVDPADDSATSSIRRARATTALSTALQQAGQAQLAALVSREPESLALYRDARGRAAARLDEYRALQAGDGSSEAAEASSAAAQLIAALDRVAEQVDGGRADEALRTYSTAVEPRLRQVAGLLGRQFDPAFEQAATALRVGDERRRALGYLALGAGGLGLLAALSLGALVARALGQPFGALARRVDLLAEGDLASPSPVGGPPEAGALGRALGRAIAGVRLVIGQVRDALGDISSSSRQFVHSAEQYAAGSQQQAAAVGEISQTMERLSHAAEQIAAGATRATRAAADGRAAVDQTAAGVRAIREAVQIAVDRTHMLRTGSDRVGAVADAISAIAERTHILALNAAIEAAAAGEYGRRFAVVAGQVRELAGDTRRATEQVKGTVGELREALEALEAGAQEARALALEVDDQAQRAASAIADVVQIVETIARATVSQHGASTELVRTMHEIAAVARESAQSSRQAADGASRLNATAAELEGLVARFRLVAPS